MTISHHVNNNTLLGSLPPHTPLMLPSVSQWLKIEIAAKTAQTILTHCHPSHPLQHPCPPCFSHDPGLLARSIQPSPHPPSPVRCDSALNSMDRDPASAKLVPPLLPMKALPAAETLSVTHQEMAVPAVVLNAGMSLHAAQVDTVSGSVAHCANNTM